MRLFVAIPLPDALLAPLTTDQPPLARIRWVPRDRVHLTLKFAGEVGNDRIDALVDALRDACRDAESPSIGCAGAGFFGQRGRPRVVWAGVQPHPALLAVEQAVDIACAQIGIRRDGADYHPHITVARLAAGPAGAHRQKSASNRAVRAGDAELIETVRRAVEWVASRDLPPAFIADRCVLYRSDLRPAGPVYTELASFGFG
ncbi:MAG: RNA 2',3'-cyclic phosphodiesterase [Spirochaetaceae bacterium]|nr:MAG: RNA 2',3'-cyclic phosphodiesterase [Spirochaetaceae bacterium]